jgi:hypothetical protein
MERCKIRSTTPSATPFARPALACLAAKEPANAKIVVTAYLIGDAKRFLAHGRVCAAKVSATRR